MHSVFYGENLEKEYWCKERLLAQSIVDKLREDGISYQWFNPDGDLWEERGVSE
jgi:hypothetical protein